MADEKMKKFEDNLAELTALVRKLEGDIPLDEAIAAFEKGISLTKLCLEELKSEKGKLELPWQMLIPIILFGLAILALGIGNGFLVDIIKFGLPEVFLR